MSSSISWLSCWDPVLHMLSKIRWASILFTASQKAISSTAYQASHVHVMFSLTPLPHQSYLLLWVSLLLTLPQMPPSLKVGRTSASARGSCSAWPGPSWERAAYSSWTRPQPPSTWPRWVCTSALKTNVLGRCLTGCGLLTGFGVLNAIVADDTPTDSLINQKGFLLPRLTFKNLY